MKKLQINFSFDYRTSKMDYQMSKTDFQTSVKKHEDRASWIFLKYVIFDCGVYLKICLNSKIKKKVQINFFFDYQTSKRKYKTSVTKYEAIARLILKQYLVFECSLLFKIFLNSKISKKFQINLFFDYQTSKIKHQTSVFKYEASAS